MSEVIYLCGRDGATETYSTDDFNTVTERILPDNAPHRTEIIRDGDVVYCVINGNDSLPIRNQSVCMGQMIPPREDWHRPNTPIPDGSYGIIRTNEDTVELLSDMTASRTLYHYLMEDMFVVSTSQRVIMHFVDSFVPDKAAIAWMISSGSLGPCQSWDKRIKALPPDARLRLDRSSWEVTMTTGSAWKPFNPLNRSTNTHRNRLEQSLDNTFDHLELDTSRWTLPLSGGFDSRELLLRLQDRPSLTTITWGTSEALEEPDSDAVRAKELADACDVPHEYYTLPQYPDDIEAVFDRFLTAGEGRIDHFQGYTDGFGVFESLASDGIEGIIRGDEGFGMAHAGSEEFKYPSEVRQIIGAKMIADFQSLPSLSIPGADTQRFPNRYEKQPKESLKMWRDRLYHIYRLPIILGALTSLKTPYVEVINPFLTREIISTVRTFPDQMRTGRQLYTEYVMDKSPPIPVAIHSPDPDRESILDTVESRRFLRANLDTRYARSILGNEVVEYTLEAITQNTDSDTDTESNTVTLDEIKRKIGTHIPSSINQRIVKYTPVDRVGRTISDTRLAFRLYIIKSMFERIEDDVQAL